MAMALIRRLKCKEDSLTDAVGKGVDMTCCQVHGWYMVGTWLVHGWYMVGTTWRVERIKNSEGVKQPQGFCLFFSWRNGMSTDF